MRPKKTVRTSVPATASHTSYPSSPPAATLHGKTQGFVLRLPPQHECIVMWCKVPRRPSWMSCYVMWSLTPPFMNVLLCDVKFHTALHESSAAVTLHGKTPGFVLRLPPQNNPHATLMQLLQCVLQHHVANLHVSTHVATQDDNNQMQAFQCNLQPEIPKHPKNCAHTQTHPKLLEATATLRQRKKRQNDTSRARCTHELPFIVSCSHFTRKNARFRAPASSPKQVPCNIHAAITMRFAASRRKPACIYARGNTRWQPSCSHPNAICNHRFIKRRIDA